MSAHIAIRDLQKSFGKKPLFDRLSLDVNAGETLTILGTSGSGKSVLLKMIIGLIDADGGSITVDGRDIVALSEQERLPIRQRVSMLFQGGALFDSMTVAENVAYPLSRQRRFPPDEIADRVARALDVVGLPSAGPMMPAELSGGMKKRVALARAIGGEPDVVLYDEPTTGLDPINTRRINDLIRSIQSRLRLTSVVVTHDLPSACMVSDRIAMLYQGRILTVDSVERFLRSNEEAVTDFVSAMPHALRGQP